LRQIAFSPVLTTGLALQVSSTKALKLINTEDNDVLRGNNFLLKTVDKISDIKFQPQIR